VLVRRGKGGRRREVGMDRWAWSQLERWDRDPGSAPGWRAALCHPRCDGGSALGAVRRPQAVASAGSHCRSSKAVRAASAPPRARGRDGT
jgi:hypothetical protein